MNATDTAALIAEANEWRNEDPDSDTTEVVSERVTSLIGRLTDALDSAHAIITEAKAVNAAPHANTKQSNSRMTAVESVLARWDPEAS